LWSPVAIRPVPRAFRLKVSRSPGLEHGARQGDLQRAPRIAWRAVPVAQALELASHGAGLVVEKRGTQAVTAAELKQSLNGDESHSSARKIVVPQQLSRALSNSSGRIVFTNGCFDILHAGHVTLLEQARARGDLLIVALNSDSSVSRLKGSARPIIPLHARLRLVAALSCVDLVSWFEEDTPATLIASINPHVLVKGADWQAQDIAGADIVQQQGGTVATIPLLQGHSTTAIVDRVRDGTSEDSAIANH